MKAIILAEQICRTPAPETAQGMRMHTLASCRRYDWRRIGGEYHHIIEGYCTASLFFYVS